MDLLGRVPEASFAGLRAALKRPAIEWKPDQNEGKRRHAEKHENRKGSFHHDVCCLLQLLELVFGLLHQAGVGGPLEHGAKRIARGLCLPASRSRHP